LTPPPSINNDQQRVEPLLNALAQQATKPVFSHASGAAPALESKVVLPNNGAGDADALLPNLTRASGDALACLTRFHDVDLHQRLCPPEQEAAMLLMAAERMRCLAAGAQLYPGIATSQLQAIADRLAGQGDHARGAENLAEAQAQVLADLLWLRWHGRQDGLDSSQQKLLGHMALSHPQLFGLATQWAEPLQQQVAHQQQFAQLIRDLSQRMGILGSWPEPESADPDSENAEAEQAAGSTGAEEGAPEPESSEPAPPQRSAGQDASSARVDRAQSGGGDPAQDDAAADDSTEPPAPALDNDALASIDVAVGYRVFSRAFDQVVDAGVLSASLAAALPIPQPRVLWTVEVLQEKNAVEFRQLVQRLAMKLERALRTPVPVRWNDAQLEGGLDTKRLARLIASPLQPAVYRQPKIEPTMDTVVSLLLDCSGSMRGRPIRLAMLTVDVLLQTLERCHVQSELLGFTTKSWKGGESREAWVEAGKPEQPGRLNDLRHVIFKTADQRWQPRRAGLGVLLEAGVLKENIDGEALQWAARRLSLRPEKRKILLVISDGAPVDDATLAANDEGLLDRHLRAVIAGIGASSANIALTAIGIGHQVDRFYPRSITIRDSGDLAAALIGELTALLQEHPRRQRPTLHAR
jgi:cobaltochelatase CobT